MFTDFTKLRCISGKGGNGVISWTRAKYLPKGGPSGGNGGKGGSVKIKVSEHIHCLDHLRGKNLIAANKGADGSSNNKTGRSGKDTTILVPAGTIVTNTSTGEILADLTTPDETLDIAEGGRGGLGNTCFKTATNRTPRKCTPGQLGKELKISLEMKMIADVGFVGLPNAGKSTLMKALTATDVKIGNYPFTTLKPNLSYLEYDDYSRVYIADIPGIIKDAHKDRGLGLAFLKHIERSKALVFIVDIAPLGEISDPIEDYKILKNELLCHDKALLDRPSIIVLNKCELDGADKYIQAFKEAFPEDKDKMISISAKESLNIEALSTQIKHIAQLDGKRYN
ncbi:MAG: GTPase Obg [Chlamydiia bacterium]|nr:GTPase Obg [Chlamydiia bacterium]